MGEHPEEQCMNIFNQEGVILKQAQSYYANYLEWPGTLYLNEYLNSNKSRYIEWKPPTIETDNQELEWTLVKTLPDSMSNQTLNNGKPKFIKVNMNDVKSFRIPKKLDKLSLFDGKGEPICTFSFQRGTCAGLLAVLKGLYKLGVSKRDRQLYLIADDGGTTMRQLDRSFAELDLFPDTKPENNYMWHFVTNFHTNPYMATMVAFSKITDIVIRPERERDISEDINETLNRSLTAAIENTTATRTQDEYEVIMHLPKLPERKDYPRGGPLTSEQWRNLQDSEGRVEDIEFTKLHIFRGGITHELRAELWKYLLDYVSWDSTYTQRILHVREKTIEYDLMKTQWKSMTKQQEENFADFRERKSLIEKDVNRTDRTITYFAGDNNPNLTKLTEILMTYVMYNFDLGYVQGMSDLLSPILHLMDDEVTAFWCFVGFMNKVSSNFDMDQAGMKEQLENLHTLLGFADPTLANYLDKHDSGNMFFCFRWLLVWFKRELSQEHVMRLWEVLWTGLPCQNFHLLISVAILETEKETLMENDYGFTEILKHINDLSGNIDISQMLNKAEGIFNQIKSATHLTDNIRIILGLPILNDNPLEDSPDASNASSMEEPCSLVNVSLPTEESYEQSINVSFL